MRLLAEILYFWKRKVQPGFAVRPGERVIDVGSGDKPFWRADVFFDNPGLGGIQRITGGGVDTGLGRFVHGSLPELPFRDGAFDFSFCAHLLEHVEDPALAIRELVRISRRGYLEIPNGVLETIQPFRSHLWFVFREGERLVFVRKSARMHRVLTANGTRLPGLTSRLRDPFIRLYWSGTIEYEVIRDPGRLEAFVPAAEEAVVARRGDPYRLVVRGLRWALYRRGRTGGGARRDVRGGRDVPPTRRESGRHTLGAPTPQGPEGGVTSPSG